MQEKKNQVSTKHLVKNKLIHTLLHDNLEYLESPEPVIIITLSILIIRIESF